MISRPEDRTKIALLVVAILAVIVFIFWNLKRALSGAADNATVPSVTPFSMNPAPTNLGGGTQPTTDYYSQFQPSTSTVDPATVDPFRSPLPKSGPLTTSSPPPSNPGPSAPSRGGGVLNPMGGNVPMAVTIENSVQLKGIVYGGGIPMAVLRIGEITYHVFLGDTIAQGFKVTQITPGMVALQHGKTTMRLAIGQARLASVAPPAPKAPAVAEAVPMADVSLPNVTPSTEQNDTRPARPEPRPAPRSEPKPEPRSKPEPPLPDQDPATVQAPRPETTAQKPAPAQQHKPAPDMGPI